MAYLKILYLPYFKIKKKNEDILPDINCELLQALFLKHNKMRMNLILDWVFIFSIGHFEDEAIF